jgi:hypothetical protein
MFGNGGDGLGLVPGLGGEGASGFAGGLSPSTKSGNFGIQGDAAGGYGGGGGGGSGSGGGGYSGGGGGGENPNNCCGSGGGGGSYVSPVSFPWIKAAIGAVGYDITPGLDGTYSNIFYYFPPSNGRVEIDANSGGSWGFNYTGALQDWIAPQNDVYEFTVIGATGGDYPGGGDGGSGAGIDVLMYLPPIPSWRSLWAAPAKTGPTAGSMTPRHSAAGAGRRVVRLSRLGGSRAVQLGDESAGRRQSGREPSPAARGGGLTPASLAGRRTSHVSRLRRPRLRRVPACLDARGKSWLAIHFALASLALDGRSWRC